MGIGVGRVWVLWWIPMGLWWVYRDFRMDVTLSGNALNTRYKCRSRCLNFNDYSPACNFLLLAFSSLSLLNTHSNTATYLTLILKMHLMKRHRAWGYGYGGFRGSVGVGIPTGFSIDMGYGYGTEIKFRRQPWYWAHRWALQKWIDRSMCCLEAHSCGHYKPCIRRRFTLAPPGEYDWMIRAWRRCGQMSNYFGHLFAVTAAFIWCTTVKPTEEVEYDFCC